MGRGPFPEIGKALFQQCLSASKQGTSKVTPLAIQMWRTLPQFESASLATPPAVAENRPFSHSDTLLLPCAYRCVAVPPSGRRAVTVNGECRL